MSGDVTIRSWLSPRNEAVPENDIPAVAPLGRVGVLVRVTLGLHPCVHIGGDQR